jgi:hypothetical protein
MLDDAFEYENVKYICLIRINLLQFSMGDRQGTFGSALTVTLPTAIEKAGTSFKLRVDYSTTEKCTAIQYLKPSQTEGKKVSL